VTTLLGQNLENSSLTLDLTVGYGAIDLGTGNPQPIKSTLQVYAWLRVDASKSRENPQPGNPGQQWVEGWITRVFNTANPGVELDPVLPQGIPTGVPIQISGKIGRIFFEQVPINGAILQYNCLSIIGERICGWFERGRS
jgi:hypothetical protein